MTARLVVFACILVWGCAAPRRTLPPDTRGARGPLVVRGAARGDPGPAIYRALVRDPATRDVVAERGEPDWLRVFCGRDGGTRVLLSYARPRRARPVEVVAEPARLAVCRSPRTGPVAVAERGAAAADESTTAPAPTERQLLECPIDPTRPDCRALCAANGPLEWCP